MPDEPKTIWLLRDAQGDLYGTWFMTLKAAEDSREYYDRYHSYGSPYKVCWFREVDDD